MWKSKIRQKRFLIISPCNSLYKINSSWATPKSTPIILKVFLMSILMQPNVKNLMLLKSENFDFFEPPYPYCPTLCICFVLNFKATTCLFSANLFHFFHKHLDLSQPHAVLLILIDLEKAFNRVSHQLMIEDLADMNIPGWLLQILISYLTGRTMFMRYRWTTSSASYLPGCTPQVAFLGICSPW